jgi:hypothetical protein
MTDDCRTPEHVDDDYQNVKSSKLATRDDYQMLGPLGFEIDRVRVDYQTDDC